MCGSTEADAEKRHCSGRDRGDLKVSPHGMDKGWQFK